MNFLFKYQAKATKKIEVIEEKRKQLVEHSEEVDKELTKAKPTVREQFGKYRKRDGSLNTRQVYDMLRSEEKKQEKVTDNRVNNLKNNKNNLKHSAIQNYKIWMINTIFNIKYSQGDFGIL